MARSDRRPLDSYQTPRPLALAICRWLAQSTSPGTIVEPSAGEGAFVAAARQCWPRASIVAVDVDQSHGRACSTAGADLFEAARWEDWERGEREPDLIVGNPPYRDAQAHVERGLSLLRPGGTLAFLLRLSFLGSASRVEFWSEHPATMIVPIVPRPSFTGRGTDGAEYAVFVWRAGAASLPHFQSPLLWIPERKSRSTPRSTTRPAIETEGAALSSSERPSVSTRRQRKTAP